MSISVRPRTRVRIAAMVIVALVLLGWLALSWGMPWLLRKEGGRKLVTDILGIPEIPFYGENRLTPDFVGADRTRRQVAVNLIKVADGVPRPTDLRFVPGMPDVLLVAGQAGRCEWIDLKRRSRGVLFEINVPNNDELGLLGIAFHPRFSESGRLFVHHSTVNDRGYGTRISEWRVPRDGGRMLEAIHTRTLLEVEQPYDNHNGGQIAFGPDSMLYIGLGDGGAGGDPHGHGQRLDSLLAKILRVDVDRPADGRAYGIPTDNPFVQTPNARPEIWAYGARNPWRFTFDERGRLVVADVGQETWEEIGFVEGGDNLGWNQREGFACYKAPADGTPCEDAAMRDPIYAYPHDDGQSITGGEIFRASSIPEITDHYMFADFIHARFWALRLPNDPKGRVESHGVIALGRFPILPSAFARDADGHVYVADYGKGGIYRFVPASEP